MKGTRRTGKWVLPVCFIVPALLIVTCLTAYPLSFIVRMSVSDWTYGNPLSSARSIGLSNFRELFSGENGGLRHAMKLTILFLVMAVPAEAILGTLIALLLNRKCIKGASVMVGLMTIPMVMMPSMVGTVQRLLFHPQGVLNYLLEVAFGVTVNWYSASNAMIAVVLADIWQWTPFFILTCYAGIQALPHEPLEAARVDGANWWQSLKWVTLPLLAPVLLVSILIRSMECLRNFDMIFNFFGGGPGNATETLPVYIYRQNIYSRALGQGSAAGLVLVAVMLVLCLGLVRVLKRMELE